MAQYVYVTGVMEAPEAITEEFHIKQYMRWVRFVTDSMKDNIYDDSISSFSYLLIINFDYVYTMAKYYLNRTLILGELNISIRRIKKLKALLHWAQEFCRISERLLVEGMTGDNFLMQLNWAL